MPQKTIDSPFLHKLREEMRAVLKTLADRHGVAIDVKAASYTPANATIRVQVSVKSGDIALTAEAQDFKLYAIYRYGFLATDLGATFLHNGEQYKLIGLCKRSPKFPVLCQRADGREIKFPADTVRLALQNADGQKRERHRINPD